MTSPARSAWQQAVITLSTVVTVSAVLAALYVGRVVLIPIAMAIFFTYVFAPVVMYIQRHGVPRMPAVLLTVAVAVIAFLSASYFVTRELASLTSTLTDNAGAIKAKVAAAKASIVGSGNPALGTLLDDISQAISEKPEPSTTVVMEPRGNSWTPSLNTVVGPATEAFGQAAFSFILVIFMLLSKTDLADRLQRLIGNGRVTATTQAMADASQRISRYLFRQLVVNASFGLVVSLGLFAIGLDYAFLWGFLIAVLRYVPYIGTWLGVIPPALFAFAIGESWTLPLATLGCVLGLEIVVNNFIEPRIYGSSLGLSDVALLISAALWSFLWGPVGLILSGPITTCLLVLGRHAPAFKFLEILLGNEPPLTPGVALFQRLAGGDQDEALRTLRANVGKEKPEAAFDHVFLPALAQVKSGVALGQIETEDERRMAQMGREVLDDILEEIRVEPRGDEEFTQRTRLLACPAHDDFDRLSLDMLTSRLPTTKWEVRVTAVATLTAELIADAAAYEPQVIVIGSLPLDSTAHTRYLCKRLRARFPGAHILVGRWGEATADTEAWVAAGATAADTSITAALVHLQAWLPVFEAEEAQATA